MCYFNKRRRQVRNLLNVLSPSLPFVTVKQVVFLTPRDPVRSQKVSYSENDNFMGRAVGGANKPATIS